MFNVWVLAILPGLAYPCICWSYWRIVKHKRYVIQQILEPVGNKNLYIRSYAPVTHTERDPFASLFDVTYHLPSFFLAIVLNSFVVFLAAFVGLSRAGLSTDVPSDLKTALAAVPLPVIAGMAGAYVWGIYEILRQYWSAELSSVALHFIWLRLLVAAAVGGLSEAAFKETFGMLAAFGLGAFPLRTLQDFVREQAKKRFQIGVDPMLGETPTLHKLQGLTPEVIDRLRDEGIDSTMRLAYADPIRLLLKTNFEWKIILDMIDQAALVIYLGDKAAELRPLGIRGATELKDAWELIQSPEYQQSGESKLLLARISAKLGLEEVDTVNLLTTIASDTHFEFIQALWRGEPPPESQASEEAQADTPNKGDTDNGKLHRGTEKKADKNRK